MDSNLYIIEVNEMKIKKSTVPVVTTTLMMSTKKFKGIMAAALLLIFLILLMPTGTAYAEDGNEGIELVEHPSIPVIVFHIDESQGTIEDMNEDENHEKTCSGTMDIIVPEGFESYVDMDWEPQTIKGIPLEYIRGRGNSTWEIQKKPYKIKLGKPNAGDEPLNMFGMGTNRHWVLLANVMDPTIIRNKITFRLSEELGFAFTPQCVPVDVIMKSDTNSENDAYLGNYYLTEQVRVDPDRLNINELKKNDMDSARITGGYLIKGGEQTDEKSPDYFTTAHGVVLANDTPSFDPDDGGYDNDAQKSYIRGHIQDFEDAIFGVDFRNRNGDRYTDLMDVKSAADYWLIQQVTANDDAYKTGSTYFYKVSDTFDETGNKTGTGKIYWGPVWDFDYAYGAYDMSTENTEGIDFYHSWITAMLYDTDENGFREMVKREWPKVKESLLAMTNDDGIIDQYRTELHISRSEDYEFWKDILWFDYLPIFSNYDDNIDAQKEWIISRVNWMDQYINSGELDKAVCKVTYMVDGEIARLEYYPKGEYINMYIPDKVTDTYKPEKEGYLFLGWENESESLVTKKERATSDKVYTARLEKKETATVTKTPDAKTLTYNGQALELVTAGEATGGTMQYALGTATEATEPYTTSIPTKTNAGTYFVWFKAVGDDNHSSTEPDCIPVIIKCKDISGAVVTLDKSTLTYNAETQVVTVKSVVLDGETLSDEAYKLSGNFSGFEVRKYTLIAEGVGNYTGSVSAEWSIVPAPTDTVTSTPTTTPEGSVTPKPTEKSSTITSPATASPTVTLKPTMNSITPKPQKNPVTSTVTSSKAGAQGGNSNSGSGGTTPGKQTAGGSVATGDDTNAEIWLFMITVCMVVLVALRGKESR